MEESIANTSGVTHRVYPANKSHLPDRTVSETDRVKTLNSGTEEFDRLGVGPILDELAIFDEVSGVQEKWDDKSRGNTAWNRGIACGQSHQEPQTDEETMQTFGAAYPAILAGTRDNRGNLKPQVRKILRIGNAIARMLMVLQAADDFCSRNKDLAPFMEWAEWILTNGGSDIGGALQSFFACFTLFDQDFLSYLLSHCDSMNHPKLGNVMTVSETRMDERTGRFSRKGVIFNHRKSVFDFWFRFKAARERVQPCLDLLKEMPEYRKPACPLRQYFLDGVGSEGILVTQEKKSGRIVGCALRALPNLDKQGTYLASVVCAIAALDSVKRINYSTEFIELLQVVGLLCNIYPFVTVLGMMQTQWDPAATASSPGGLLGYVIGKIVNLVGCLSGGPGRRCMNSLNNNEVPLAVFRANCHSVGQALTSLMQKASECLQQSKKQRRKMAHDAFLSLSNTVKHVGDLSATHVIHCMALFRAAPAFILDYAVVSPDTSANRREKNPCMDEYLGIKDETIRLDDGVLKRNRPKATVREKYSIINRALARVARVFLRDPNFTESQAENLGCEGNRTGPAYDLWFGGHGFFRKTDPGSPFPEWRCLVPTLPEGFENMQASDALSKIEFVEQAIYRPGPRDGTDTGCGLWDPLADKQMLDTTTIRLGPKPEVGTPEHEAMEFTTKIIGKEVLDQHVGLLDRVKVAMLARRGRRTLHEDTMRRLNAITELKRLLPDIPDHSSAPKVSSGTKRPASEAGSPSKRRAKKRQHGKESTMSVGTAEILDANGWDKGTPNKVGGLELRYHVFESDDRAEGTLLANGFAGYSTEEDFRDCRFNGTGVLHNDAHACLVGAVKEGVDVPRLKTKDRIKKKSKGKRSVTVSEATNGSATVYAAGIGFLPSNPFGIAHRCKVRDAIAKTLGGVALANGNEHVWHFVSEKLAIQFLFLSLLCVSGSQRSRRKLFNRVRRAIPGCGGVASVCGYMSDGGGDRHDKAEDDDRRPVYYLIALGDSGKEQNLVLAIPRAHHIEKKQTVGMTFVRLL